MDLNLEIEHGSQADNIGKNLGQSAANLGKDMVMSAGVGAANVIASTGINIGNGSKDQIIADNISAAINLTGEQGLTNLASGLENYSQQLAAMGLNAPEQLVNILLGTVTDVLGETGVINQIQKGLQLTTNTVDLAKKGLNIACSTATAIANVKKLLTKLNKMQDVDVTCIPSVKDSVSALSASLIQQLTAQYEALKQQLIVFYNSMICTSNDAVLDNIIVSINNILEVVEPALDPILQQNTGFTISEVRNICNQGFAYIGMIERAAAAKRKEDQEAEEAAENQTIEDEEKTDNEGSDEASELGNDLKDQAAEAGEEAKDTFKKIGTTVSDDAKKMSEEAKEKFKKEKIEKSKEKWKEKTKDLTKEAAKEKLLAWLKDQSIILQNAFHILVIKDTIDRIKTFLSQLQNTSIENQADLLNMLTDVLDIFEMLGIKPGAVGITLDDLKALGMGVAGTVVDTAVNIGQQVQDNATAATQQMMAQAGVGDVVGGARNAVANISDLSNLTNKLNETGGNINNATQGVKDKINGTIDSATNVGNNSGSNLSELSGDVTSSSLNSNMASDEDSGVSVSGKSFATNIVKATGSDIVAGMVDSGINSVIDAASNMDMDAVANGGGQEMLQSTLDNINPNRAKAIPPFTYTQSNQDKNIYIDITINKRPSLHLIKIMSFIKSFKSGKDQIFNNGATKQIKDAFYEAWELDDPLELLVNAKVDGITKFYNFTFTVNKSERNNPDNEVEEIESEQLLSGDTSGISGEAQSLMNNATGMSNNAGGQITSLAGNATEQASNLVNSGTEAASNMVDGGMNAVSQLSKVDINIDMSAIESVLQGKVLMFDPIIKILQALLPVVEIIKVVCKLLQNYMINKEFVRTKQHVDLLNATREAAQFVMGLKDIIELKDTNFFTIRTQKMADWAADTFRKNPDENGIVTINIIGTTKLNTYCAINFIRPECPLDLKKGTTLYYDKWGIENGRYNDGTTRGLDNIEINRDLGEVYYDSKQRSTIASEILRARKRKVDPNYVKTSEIVDESSSIDDLLNLTEFASDEMEGQQTLNLCNLNLCPAPPKSEKAPDAQEKASKQSAVIIEFGDEYTLGDRVDYNIIVKPGQTINEGDILAYITKGDTQQPIRTKFTGVVRGINDYSHLYPSAARRHFIIDGIDSKHSPVPCMPVDYNVDDVMNLSKRFKKASELGAFILNCMPLSILPILLVNANRDNNTNNYGGSITTGGIQETTEVFSKFEEIMSDYDTSINAFNNDIMSLSQPDNFNSTDSTNQITDSNGKAYYKVPIDRNEKIKNSIMELREKMIDTAISVYNKTLYEKPIGSYSYEDCIGLAFDDNLSLTYGIYKENSKVLDKDKKIVNINYYINLLQNIPESKNMAMPPINIDIASINSKLNKMYGTEGSTDAVDVSNDKTVKGILNSLSQLSNNTEDNKDNEDNYINEYRDLIESIISNRLSLEQKTTNQIYTYFNQYYSKNILGSIKTVDAFTQLKNKIVDQEYSLNDNTSILNLIKLDKLRKTYNLKDSKDYNKFQKADSDKMKKDEKYYNQCQYALTMFVYLLHADVEKTIKPLNKILIESSGNYNTESSSQYTGSSSKKSNIDQKRKNNQKYFELIQTESKLIMDFWKKVLAAYNDPNGKYNLDNVINDIKGYADKMNSYAKWPTPINIKVNNTNYELYTFADRYEDPKSAPEEIIVPADMGNVEIPDPVVDLDNLPEPRDRDKITIMDYSYWLVYMLNATLFTLNPFYWADGFEFPPFIPPTPFPAIYFPIAPPVMIPVVNVLMVFGIALRGIWPAPIILMVNLSSSDIDAMVFIKIALEIAKDIYRKSQELIENGIPKMVNKIAEGYISENQMAQKTIEKFKIYSSIIRAIPIEDKALIEKKFNEALVDEMNKQTKLNETNNKLEKTKNKLKNFDRRQIITRESDLGNGPEPM